MNALEYEQEQIDRMNNWPITKKIAALSESRSRVLDKAVAANRKLTAEEAGIIAKLDVQINNFRMELPANSPLSLQGPQAVGHNSGCFQSLAEQTQAVIRAGAPGAQVDQRLYDIRAAASGLNETVPSEGGFLVQTDYQREIITSVFQTSLLANRCRRIQISGNSNSIKINGVDETSRVSGSRYGGIVGYWVGESAEITKSKPKFRQMELLLRKLAALVYLTDELVEDTSALDVFFGRRFLRSSGFSSTTA